MSDSMSSPDLESLVAQHHQVLFRYAYRLSGSVADAEDLTQQVFMVAHQKLSQLRRVQSTRSWLFTVLRNCYLKGFRKPVPVSASSLELDIDGVAAEVPSNEIIDREALQAALDQLPDEFKIVLVMFYFEHCSYKEIAEQLSLPPGTVMSRLSRAKRHLRRRLFESEAASTT